jgi:hypothetical protein
VRWVWQTRPEHPMMIYLHLRSLLHI